MEARSPLLQHRLFWNIGVHLAVAPAPPEIISCGGSGRTTSPRRMTRTGQSLSWSRTVTTCFSDVVSMLASSTTRPRSGNPGISVSISSMLSAEVTQTCSRSNWSVRTRPQHKMYPSAARTFILRHPPTCSPQPYRDRARRRDQDGLTYRAAGVCRDVLCL